MGKSKSDWQARSKKYDLSGKKDLSIDIITHMYKHIKDTVESYDEDRKWVYQPTINYIETLYKCAMEPEAAKNVLWHSFNCPPEMAYAMGMQPFNIEFINLVLGPWFEDYFLRYVDGAHDAYIPDHICSYSKGTIGMALKTKLPQPSALIHTSLPCDNGLVANQALAAYYNIKSFCIETPYDDSEETHEFVAREVEQCFEYLEHQTGRKLDIDRLHEVMEKSHKARELLFEINELKKNKPCPLPTGSILRQTFLAMSTMAGSDETVRFFERHLEDAKDRASRGVGIDGVEEKIRTSWLYSFISYDWTLYDWMQENYGAVPVSYLASVYYYKPGDISSKHKLFRALGDSILDVPMGRQMRGHLDRFVEDTIDWVGTWKCDAAIFAGHVACKAGWAVAQIIKEALMEELGVPTLIFECDTLDPRVASIEQVRRKLEPFFEQIAG